MACGPKGNAAGRAGSGRTLSLSPARTGEGDAPDRRDPLGSETGRGEGALGRNGPGAGKRAGEEFSGPRREKKKGRMGWAERVGEREKTFHFPKRFKHFQIKFKLKDLNLR